MHNAHPLPARASLEGLDEALREMLHLDPGLHSLRRLFQRAALRPSEAIAALLAPGAEPAVPLDLLLQAERPLRAGAEHLERALAGERDALQPAAALLGAGIYVLQHGGFAASLLVTPLRNLHLHTLADSRRTATLAAEACAWADTALRQWRVWSDRRFGAIRCVAWSRDGRYCESLGYAYAGRDYRIEYFGERIRHQGWEWKELARTRLAPLMAARGVWRELARGWDAQDWARVAAR